MDTFSNSKNGIKAIINAAEKYASQPNSPMATMFGGGIKPRDAEEEASKIMNDRTLAIISCSQLVPQSFAGYLSDLQSPSLEWEIAKDRLKQLKIVLPYQEWKRLCRSFGYYPEMEAAAEEGEMA